MARGYQRTKPSDDADLIDDAPDDIVRVGARHMLAAALEEEVAAFLGAGSLRTGQAFRGYRNGHLPSRELTVGVSAVEVRVPRVAQVPAEVAAEGFQRPPPSPTRSPTLSAYRSCSFRSAPSGCWG